MAAGGYDGGGRPYPGSMVLAAALATFFFPVISLIAALLLIGQERDPLRRRSLRTWAFASGGFLLLQILIGLALFASVSSGSVGEEERVGCFGGPEPGAAVEERADGTAVFPCVGGGTVTVDFSEGGDVYP